MEITFSSVVVGLFWLLKWLLFSFLTCMYQWITAVVSFLTFS